PAERSQRVDRQGAAGRGETRGEGHRDQQSGDGGEDRRVGRSHFEEQRAEIAGEAERRQGAGGETQGGQTEGAADHEAQHRGAAGAERDAEVDLARALRDQITDDAVDAERGQEQRGGGKDAEQQRGQAARGGGRVDHLLHGADAVDGDGRVDGADRSAGGGGDRRGVAGRAHDEGHARGRPLRLMQVQFGNGRRFQAAAAEVGDDADDRPRAAAVGEHDAAADRVAGAEEAAHEGLVHKGHGRGAESVVGIKRAAAGERDSHGGEEIGGDLDGIGAAVLAVGGVALDRDRKVGLAAGQRERRGGGRGLDAGEGAEAIERGVVVVRNAGGELARVGGSRGRGEGDAQRENAVGAEAAAGGVDTEEAGEEQAGAGQQEHRERELSRHEETAQDAAGGRGGSAAGFQLVADLDARGLPRGGEAEEQGGGN